MISREQVAHVANLAKLEFDDSELENFTSQLDKIVDFVDQLSEVDTKDVAPTTHITSAVNVFREDVPVKSQTRAELLKNVPETTEGLIRVPAIIEKEEDE
ncbi:Asp-tRNA(Asn)/Glu-tRNA(Gln) amidotransferase subunit GatC [Agrilactobacillus fermenti]|uniref:Asp-tRNA(Asn)/Glu-tRNA(Gln) amidotransferase subunit GatC n=1 Tax=Agrilactobacillus fermenti TaxID=2586909 RepID=UPI001E4F869C|nr:Asp-tRNA(Asn)/Glu-tRNA(Gln) amidotransferase subunit GatC [Agrilactobacillus fermenti]MCD2255146.1 Asp-tRNA(Asn)/Glu-tRNA(Gln) amidotransferase subunit GatC [Agrilactobacillus fermenti]